MENPNNPSPNSLKRKPEGLEEDLSDLKRPIGDAEPLEMQPKESHEKEGEKISEKLETETQEKSEKKVEDCENTEKNKEIQPDSGENKDESKIQSEDSLQNVDAGKEPEGVKVHEGENSAGGAENCEKDEKECEVARSEAGNAEEGGKETVENSQGC